MARGFYSVVQYCPDRFRAESVNVGLVLLRPQPHAVRIRMATQFDRAKKLFKLDKANQTALSMAIEGMKFRLEQMTPALKESVDLAAFASSRANDLRLTDPRLLAIEDIDEEIDRLFLTLVETPATAAQTRKLKTDTLPPRLRDVFSRLQLERRVWKPGTITVPIYNRSMDIPWAYRNGVVNLIKPHRFSIGHSAESQAERFAIHGHLIQKHPVGGDQQRLIVVSTEENPRQAAEIDQHVEPLLKEYDVRLIRPPAIDDFACEVEQAAH